MNKSLGIYNIIDEDEINKSITRVINSGINFNTYTTPKGIKELRIQISKFVNDNWKYEVNYKNMLITSGSQQSINLITYALLKEGDTVLIEQPTYFGAIDVFKKKNVNLVGINLKEDGLDLEELEKKIIEHSPKLIYVTPTFNNPTGYSWSNENRKEFLKIINKYDVFVLEDDPYSLINYTEIEYDILFKLNDGKNIIYLGTFSKYISPSINVGYIMANSDILDIVYSFKESFDLCTSAFLQYVVLDYLKNNDLRKVINKKIEIYKEFLDKTIKDLENNYSDSILCYSKPKGGLFMCVKFKEAVDGSDFESGNKYYIDGKHDNETRINTCNIM